MSTDNEQWIKWGEMVPQDQDYPIWLCEPGHHVELFTSPPPSCIITSETVWQPVARPAPPKETPQADFDVEAYRKWRDGFWEPPISLADAWIGSLKWERAEVANLIGRDFSHVRSDSSSAYLVDADVINALRKRCAPTP